MALRGQLRHRDLSLFGLDEAILVLDHLVLLLQLLRKSQILLLKLFNYGVKVYLFIHLDPVYQLLTPCSEPSGACGLL